MTSFFRRRQSNNQDTTHKFQKKYLRQVIKNIAQNDPDTKEVMLDGHAFTQDSIAQFTMSLVNNNQVRVLYLQNCGIDDRGAHLIAFALNKNTSVQHLWLNGNTISSSGAVAIANVLGENCTLLTVGLCDNDIGNSGGREIRSALKENQVITDILLDGNRIKERIVNDIARRCDRKDRLS